MRHIIFVFLVSYYSFSQTTIEKTTLGWSLLVDGSPLEIKGATFGCDKEVENFEAYFKDLKFLGLHTIRTWVTDKNTPQLLDAADKYGIKVMLGI